jgi:uncharacterized protein VirK/YbjX
MLFKIREPIWKGRKVGLNDAILDKENKVEILFKQRNGERLYPYTYTITKEKAQQFPIQILKGHWLRIIPIIELSIGKSNG